MTPCEKKGYKVGDKFLVIRDQGIDGFREGDVVTLNLDDGSHSPRFWSKTEGRGWYMLLEEDVKEINKPSPEDKITVTITYGELAKIYAYMGCTNGRMEYNTLWHKAKELLDPTKKIRAEAYSMIRDTISFDVFDYRSIEEEWLSLLFPREPALTEQQKKVIELEETILKAKQQIEELKGEGKWDGS